VEGNSREPSRMHIKKLLSRESRERVALPFIDAFFCISTHLECSLITLQHECGTRDCFRFPSALPFRRTSAISSQKAPPSIAFPFNFESSAVAQVFTRTSLKFKWLCGIFFPSHARTQTQSLWESELLERAQTFFFFCTNIIVGAIRSHFSFKFRRQRSGEISLRERAATEATSQTILIFARRIKNLLCTPLAPSVFIRRALIKLKNLLPFHQRCCCCSRRSRAEISIYCRGGDGDGRLENLFIILSSH
jgi:hypothetical protein